MPYIAPKKTATAAALSWDAFPPPPPEAEDWQPDPDWVAKPGDLPDPRFNRDPYEERRKAIYKKENKMYNIPADAAESLKTGLSSLSPSVTGSTSARSGLGAWPAPVPRATGFPCELVNNPSPPLSVNAAGSVTGTPYASPNTASMSSTTRIITTPKGTMENLPMAPPATYRSQTLMASTTSAKPVSPAKSIGPTWAAPLEKILAEDAFKAQAHPAEISKESKKSIPPHLRKKLKPESSPVGSQLSPNQLPRLDPTAKTFRRASNTMVENILVDEDDRADDEALAWKLATTQLGFEDVQQGLKLQETMLSQYVGKPPGPSDPPTPPASVATKSHRHVPDYGHYIKVKLVTMMEDDLDLNKRATKRELMAMNSKDMDRYILKVSSAHEHWYQAEHRLDHNNGNDSD